MRYKAIVGLILVGMTSIQLFIFSVVHAATITEIKYRPTTIFVSGHSSLQVTHIIAQDPWSGKDTTWIPISFVQKALKEVGFETTWNGKTNAFSFVKYPPGHGLAALGNPESFPTKNQIVIYLVAGAPPSLSMPMLTDNGVKYMPIYYLNTWILNHYWRTNAKWDGNTNTWSFHFSPIW